MTAFCALGGKLFLLFALFQIKKIPAYAGVIRL